MSAAIDQLLAIARGEGDTVTAERDGNTTYHTMTRPMSVAVDTAASGNPALSYLQSAGDPATEGFIDEAADVVITFPLRADVAHVGKAIASGPAKKAPGPWLIVLLAVAGVFQLLRAVLGDFSILRAAVGLALIFGAIASWRRR